MSSSNKQLTSISGHLENDETPFQAAERETKEESGLDLGDLDVLRGFEVKVTYPVRGAPKDVHYFLARLRNFQQEIQLSDEHQNFRWMTLQDALQVIEHEHTRSVLEQGERFINNLTES